MSRLPQLRASLLAAAKREAARRQAVEGEGEPQSPEREGKRRAAKPRGARRLAGVLPVPAMIAVGLLLALGAGAFAASKLIATGPPVKGAHLRLKAGVGVAIAPIGGLLGIAAADPEGGLPWTLRAFETSRGLRCVQLGRFADGRIGVLGEDGAFGDDGRFHPLPLQVNASWGNCVLPDAEGNAFMAMSLYSVPASGVNASCAHVHCPARSARDIFYGLLGPKARSITYLLHGHARKASTIGKQGAYLIVLPARAYRHVHDGTAVPGVLPSGARSEPIRSITYTGGRTCTITASGNRDEAGRRCTPIGYAPRAVPASNLSERTLASKVRLAFIPAPVRERDGGQALRSREASAFGSGLRGGDRAARSRLEVSFTARVAVTDARSDYTVTIDSPSGGLCHAGALQASRSVSEDVAAGRQLHVYFRSRGHPGSLFPHCWGTYKGAVYYTVAPASPSRVTLAGALPPHAREMRALGLRTVLVGRFHYAVTRAESVATLPPRN